MPAMPLWYLLLPFAAIVLASALFFFFNLFHIRRYGVRSTGTVLLLLTYIVTFLGILGGSALVLGTIDWQKAITADDVLPHFSSTLDFGL